MLKHLGNIYTNASMSEYGQKTKSILTFLLGVPLTILSLFFVIYFIYANRGEVLPYLKHFDLLPASLGLIFLCLFFFTRSLVWREFLHLEGFHHLTARESTYLLAVSELKRYIPGSVIAIAGRVSSLNILKIPPRTTIRMIFYESILFVITSLIISIPAIFFLFSKNHIESGILYFAGPVFLIIPVGLFLINARTKNFIKLLPKYFNACLLMLAAWSFFGIGSYLAVASFYYINPYDIVQVSSIMVLSWFVGYIVIIAPLGLGVREAFLAYSLSYFSPIGIAAALAVIARVAFTASEIIFLALSYLFYKYINIKTKLETQTFILWGLIFSYISYFTYVSFQKYNNFFTGRFDLGNMDQTVWNTLHGRFFQLTNPDGINTVSRLAFHSDFILVLLAPFYAIWEDPRMLLLIQTVVLGLGAWFVYKISETVLKNKNLSVIFAASYLLNPFIQKQNLFDFHAVTLATTFLLGAFYFSLVKKYLPFAIFILLAVLTKENLFAVLFFFGIWLAIRERNKYWLALSFVGVAVFYILVSKIIPDARGGQHFAVEYFSDFGSSPFEITKNIIAKPLKTIPSLIALPKLFYLYTLGLPTGFLSVIFPLYLIFASPDLLINMLSNNGNLISINYHYDATIVPFIYVSSIFAAGFLLKNKIRYVNIKSLGFYLIGFSLLSAYLYGTLPGARNPSLEIYTDRVVNNREIDNFLKKIPANLSVASSNNLGSHLSHRERIYTIPRGIYQADVIALLLNDEFAQPSLKEQEKLVAKLRSDSNYVELYESGDFIAFSKKIIPVFINK